MTFSTGDIVKVDLNPIKGHEQGNYRPVLVVNYHAPKGTWLVAHPQGPLVTGSAPLLNRWRLFPRGTTGLWPHHRVIDKTRFLLPEGHALRKHV